ncbi:MAG: hypothetical protein EOP00_10385 [Pedobacter sp.]|nr:MAG: hypothetical protein EOP00_10385 [Pedobacter sp.]
MKNKILGYSLLRLVLLATGIFLIYHFAFYFLPKNIQEDQFSFMGELSLTVNFILIFSILYTGFIYWEYRRFRKKSQLELSKVSLVILAVGLLIMLAALLLSFKI